MFSLCRVAEEKSNLLNYYYIWIKINHKDAATDITWILVINMVVLGETKKST